MGRKESSDSAARVCATGGLIGVWTGARSDGCLVALSLIDCPFFVMSSLSKVPAVSALPIYFVIKVHAVPAVSVIL